MSTRNVRRIALAGFIALALGACSDDSEDATDTTEASAEETTTTAAAAEETTTTAAADAVELTAGAELIRSGAAGAGIPEPVASCIGQTTYDQLTPEEQAEVDAAGEAGTALSDAINTRVTELGTDAFLTCTAEEG
jgi:ABC-type Fe3+-hydroxamate transport system substrate-binding protein